MSEEKQQAGKAARKKQIKIPSKTTLNLLIKEKTLASPSRLIPILVLIFVGAFLFSKYAVVARLEKVNRAEAQLAAAESNLEQIQSSYADYDAVRAQYNCYSYEQYDRTIPDRVKVLDMLERRFFPISTVQSLSINGRDISLVLADISLETLTYINQVLMEEEPLIEYIEISSYVDNTDHDDSGRATTTASMSIRLADASADYLPEQTAEQDAGAGNGGGE